MLSLHIFCPQFLRAQIRMSKPTGVIYAIISASVGGISSLWVKQRVFLLIIHLFLISKVQSFDYLYSDMEKGKLYTWLFPCNCCSRTDNRGKYFAENHLCGLRMQRSSWFPIIITGVYVRYMARALWVCTAIFGDLTLHEGCRSLVICCICTALTIWGGTVHLLTPITDTNT